MAEARQSRPQIGRAGPLCTLDRYVLRLFAWPLAYTLLAVASLAVVVDIFERLAWLIPASRELGESPLEIVAEVALFYAARLGLLLFDLGPAIPLVAASVAVAGMLKRREIVAAKAAGVSAQRALMPLVGAALACGLIVFAARELVGPEMVVFTTLGRTRFLGQVEKPSVQVSAQGTTPAGSGFVLNANALEPSSGVIHGLVASYWAAGDAEPTYVWSGDARWDGSRWVLDKDARLFRYPEGADAIVAAPVGALETNLSPRVLEMEAFGEGAIGLGELLAGRSRTDMATALHWRIAAPLGWVALILLGLPLVVGGADRSALMGFAWSLAVVAIYAVVVSVGRSLALNGSVPPAVGVWAPQAGALLLGALTYWRMET